jgi:hypothetical protein
MHSKGTRYVCLHLVFGEPLEGFLALVGTQLRRTAKTDSTGLCSASPLTCTGTNQLTLELSRERSSRATC